MSVASTKQRRSSPSSTRRMASEYASSPEEHPALQARKKVPSPRRRRTSGRTVSRTNWKCPGSRKK
jgi:uncharacterized protein (DUF2336 family)